MTQGTAGGETVTLSNVVYTPKGAGTVPVLNGITLSFEPGSITALLGRSGSGKTTLLRTINGLVLPESGDVSIGSTLLQTANVLRVRQRIGYVLQESGLFPHMTVGRNVALPLELHGVPAIERASRAATLLDCVGLPAEEFAGRTPAQLSGGQRQRAGLARALVADPPIVLMDEPFGALDPVTRSEMQHFVRDLLAPLKKTVVIVTHDLPEALFLADRVLVLDAGHIAADLPAGSVPTSDHPALQGYFHASGWTGV